MSRSNNSFTSWVSQADIHGPRVLMPEEKLFVAVLSQAAHDAFSTHVGKLERDAARAFFTNKGKRFRDICELAGREPQYVYEKVRRKILNANGWNTTVSCSVDGHTRSDRQSANNKKRGPRHSLNGAKYG